MPRSPWRDAIDGQASVLRALKSQGTRISLHAYTEDSYTLNARYPNPAARRVQADRAGREMADVLAAGVRAAEPFLLTHDIQEHVTRLVNTADGAPNPPFERAMAHPYGPGDPPVVGPGFLWLDHPVSVVVADPQRTPAVVIRAILFSPANRVRNRTLMEDPTAPSPDGAGLGLTSFIDADASGWADKGRGQLSGLIPIVHPYLVEGETLEAHLADLVRRYPAAQSATDQVMHAWPTLFTAILFGLMREKVVLWGGSGLERDARRQAERDGLKSVVQVVTWRKAEYRYPEGHVPSPPDWSCRWSVKEHVRRYKSGKVVTIKSYIKGPPSAPFKAPNERANLIRR